MKCKLKSNVRPLQSNYGNRIYLTHSYRIIGGFHSSKIFPYLTYSVILNWSSIQSRLSTAGASCLIFLSVFNHPSIAGENQIRPTPNKSQKQHKQVTEALTSTPLAELSGSSVTTPQFFPSDRKIAQPQNHGNVEFSTPIHTIPKSPPGAEALGVVSLESSLDNSLTVPVYSSSANNTENVPGEGNINLTPSNWTTVVFSSDDEIASLRRNDENSSFDDGRGVINKSKLNRFNRFNLPSTQPSTPSNLVATSNETSTNNQDINEILNQLEELPKQEFTIPIERGYLLSPALTIANPNGYGADGRTLFVSASYQRRTRFTKTNDGELGLGIGVGNAVKSVGIELAYTLNTFGTSQDFGSGAFSIKVHRRISEDFAVAAGWNQFASILINPKVPFDYPKNSYYVVATKVFKTRPYISQPFSRVAVTLGVGSGQFLPFDKIQAAVARDEAPTGLGIFGSLSFRVLRPVSAIVEWTGQDLGVGLSIVPFKNIPLVMTPAIRDITGAGDGARFIMGAGVGIRF